MILSIRVFAILERRKSMAIFLGVLLIAEIALMSYASAYYQRKRLVLLFFAETLADNFRTTSLHLTAWLRYLCVLPWMLHYTACQTPSLDADPFVRTSRSSALEL